MNRIASQSIGLGPCQIHTLQAGDTGTDILLLHGMKFRAETWRELGTLDKLAENGCRAVAVDMPGFGDSRPCESRADQLLSDLIDQVNMRHPVVIGPSMGGQLALELAISHPQQVGALVLVGAVGVEENRDHLAAIRVPVLLVWGSEDRISPRSNSDLLLERLPDARRVIITGASHPCYLEKPEVWHQELLNFLHQLTT